MVVDKRDRREYSQHYYERNRARVKQRRDLQRWVHRMQAIEYLGGVCRDCGYKDNLDALEFDHIKSRLRNVVGRLFGRSWEIIKAELDRCELVCANCHRIRTATRRREQKKHEQACDNS